MVMFSLLNHDLLNNEAFYASPFCGNGFAPRQPPPPPPHLDDDFEDDLEALEEFDGPNEDELGLAGPRGGFGPHFAGPRGFGQGLDLEGLGPHGGFGAINGPPRAPRRRGPPRRFPGPPRRPPQPPRRRQAAPPGRRHPSGLIIGKGYIAIPWPTEIPPTPIAPIYPILPSIGYGAPLFF